MINETNYNCLCVHLSIQQVYADTILKSTADIMGNIKSKFTTDKQNKNREPKLSQKERYRRLNAFRHFIRLHVCGAFSVQSPSPQYGTPTVVPIDMKTFFKQDKDTDASYEQELSHSPALGHRDFNLFCNLFDSNADPNFPGQWNIQTLETVLDWPNFVVDRIYLWIKLLSITHENEPNHLYGKDKILLFEEIFQWLIDLMYPYSILSTIIDETVRQGISLSTTSSTTSFPSSKKHSKYRPHHWSISSSGNPFPVTFTHRKFSLGNYQDTITKISHAPNAPMIPFEFIFFLFSTSLEDLLKDIDNPKSPPENSFLFNIQHRYHLTKENFKTMIKWILRIQFVQLHPDFSNTAQYSSQTILQEMEACHRMVEGILSHSIDNLFLSPMVSIASNGCIRPPEPLELIHHATKDDHIATPVLSFHTWRDWIMRNCQKLFDPLYIFLRKTFLEPSLPNIVISESTGYTPSPKVWKDISTTPKNQDSNMLSLVSDDPTLTNPAERIERIRTSSESNSTSIQRATYYPVPLPTIAATLTPTEDAPQYKIIPQSLVLDTALLWLLHHALPLHCTSKQTSLLVPWELLFSTNRDGFSMTQLKHRCLDYPGATLLLFQGEFSADIREIKSNVAHQYTVIAGICIGSPWKSSNHYWGWNHPCMLYILYPVLEIFPLKTSGSIRRGFSPKNVAFFNTEKGIGFGGSLQEQFRLFIDEYMEYCIFNIHGEDETFAPSYLPLLHNMREIKEKDKLKTIILPDPLKLSITSLEIYGLGGKDASEKWIQSKMFEKQFAEQRESVNVHVKMHDIDTERMLLSLMDIASVGKYSS